MVEDYAKARKMGRKQVREALAAGRYPYPPALDDMLPRSARAGEVSLGTLEIPLALIAGTVTPARSNVFSEGFLPIAEPGTEFAIKWATLYESQVEEGLRDPIVVYEYLQRFYVLEGNKRVSVMRYLDNPTIPAKVTRIMPREADDIDNEGYREFLTFWRVAPVYGLTFSEHGSYARLAKLLGRDLETPWPEDEVRRLRTALYIFSKAFEGRGGGSLPITMGDAFLIYLQAFATSDPLRMTEREADERIGRIWEEFVVASHDDAIEYLEQPTDRKTSLIPTIRSLVRQTRRTRVAFVYDRGPDESGWVALHEQGRLDLERRLGNDVETVVYSPCYDDDSFDAAIEAAVANEDDLVVTVSPRQFDQTLRAAAAHPDLRIINCSINLSSGLVRTFYARMYEAKFLMGALAASVAEGHRLGYVAFSPIYGSIAEVNAFAIGASLVDPHAEVHLKWITSDGSDWKAELRDAGVSVVAGRDHLDPRDPGEPYGLYRVLPDGSTERLALPVWDWGRYYELILRSIRGVTWDEDGKAHKEQAINYWWGMSSDVIRLELSDIVPLGTRHLVGILHDAIVNGTTHPFEGELFAQKGALMSPQDRPRPTNEQIASMRWLAANVVGRLPKSWELSPEGREDVEAAGVLTEQTDAEEA